MQDQHKQQEVKMNGWLPIETAPRDGTVIIVPCGVAHWHHDDWHSLTGIDWPGRPMSYLLKYYQPIPAPPPATDDAEFLTRILVCARLGERVTAEDVARLRKLADWADSAPPPCWDGRLDSHETARAVAAARDLIIKALS